MGSGCALRVGAGSYFWQEEAGRKKGPLHPESGFI